MADLRRPVAAQAAAKAPAEAEQLQVAMARDDRRNVDLDGADVPRAAPVTAVDGDPVPRAEVAQTLYDNALHGAMEAPEPGDNQLTGRGPLDG